MILVSIVSGILTHKAASIVSILLFFLVVVVISFLIIMVVFYSGIGIVLINKMALSDSSSLIVFILKAIKALMREK